MPRIDFSTVEDAKGFDPVPEGTYLCRVDSIKESVTRGGDEMWALRLAIVDGPHKDRCVFDNLPFSPKGLKRVKLLCGALGLDTTGEIELTPNLLIGRTCRVEVNLEEYVDEKGQTKETNTVPFAGYSPVDLEEDGSGAGADDKEEPPF